MSYPSLQHRVDLLKPCTSGSMSLDVSLVQQDEHHLNFSGGQLGYNNWDFASVAESMPSL